MSSNIVASAYRDNTILQSLLTAKIPSTALTLPIPTWFSTLRHATQSLNLPSVDHTVCDALAQYVLRITEGQQIKANAQKEVWLANEKAESAIEAARQTETASLKAQKRVFAAEALEKIWRKHLEQTSKLGLGIEKRINVLQGGYRTVVESLRKRLKSLEGKLEKAQTDGEEGAVEKLATDVSKARIEVEKAEKKRVELLEIEHSILQARAVKLRAEKEKLEVKLVEARTEAFTPETQRIGELRVQMEGLRGEHDIQTVNYVQLDKKHAELEGKYAVLDVKHSELQKKYDKMKSTLDKAVEMARANKRSRVSEVSGMSGKTPVSVEQGKKRASTEKDQIGGDAKRAKIGIEVKEFETSVELTSTQNTMVLVQKWMDVEVRPKDHQC